MKTDSTKETLEHIKKVNAYLGQCATALIQRGIVHDQSKLESPEKEMFDEVTDVLKGITYGSNEYKAQLEKLKPALAHHYAHNSHHPEHYVTGIDGMNLLDIIEMLVDWKAASERHKDGDIYRSIEINAERFKMSEQLVNIFKNTANVLFIKN
jgi:hypothetical protein